MSMTQQQIIDIIQANNKSLATELLGGTAPGRPGLGSGGGGGTGILNSMNNALQNTTDSLIKLTVGTYGLNDALDDSTAVLGFFGDAGKAIEGLTKKIGAGAIDLNNSLKDVSKSGFNFEQDLGLFASSVASARMSIPQFQAIIAESGKQIAGLAGTAEKGGLQFLALNKELKETDLARQLQATGIGFEELDKMLVISASNRRGLDMTQASVQKSVIDSALGMTVEMDNVARLTGISRQEQQKALEAQLRKNEVEIAVMAMSEEERKNYEKNSLMLARYGKEVQDVYTALSTGGIRTAQDSLKAAAIGPEFARLASELADANKDTSTAGEQRRKLIKEQMDIELVRIMQDKDELRIRAINASAGGEFGKVQADATVGMKAYGTAMLNAQRDADNAKITLAQQLEKIEAEFGKARTTALDGAGIPGAQTAQLINRTEALIKDVSAGVAKGFDGLNIETGLLIKNIENLNNYLKPYTTEDVTATAREVARTVSGGRIDGEVPPEVAAVQAGRRPPTEPKALGGPVNFGKLYTVGEEGMEFFSPKQDGEIISNNTIKSMMNGLGDLQIDMKSALSNIRSSMPTTGQFQEMFSSIAMPSMPAVQQASSQSTSSIFAGEQTTRSDANTELIRGIEGLNMRVERLIAAVEDGSEKSVRAVKSTGNLIA
jgi:hypothetical protein